MIIEEKKVIDNKIDELIYKINTLKLEDIKRPKSQNKELVFGKIWVSNLLVDEVELLLQKEAL